MRQHRLVVGAAVAVLLVVLAAAAEGLTTPSGWRPELPGAPLPTPTPTRPPTELEVGPEAAPLDLSALALPAVLLGAAVLALLVALLVLRLWRRRTSRRERLGPVDGVAGESLDVTSAPVVRRGIARSLEELEGPRDLDDAVVRAWLGLEETAQDAGLARLASETPTEFTTRLLARVPADREAVEVLRALYSRARFGTAAGRRSSAEAGQDAERARAALRALARSWDAAGTGQAQAPAQAPAQGEAPRGT